MSSISLIYKLRHRIHVSALPVKTQTSIFEDQLTKYQVPETHWSGFTKKINSHITVYAQKKCTIYFVHEANKSYLGNGNLIFGQPVRSFVISCLIYCIFWWRISKFLLASIIKNLDRDIQAEDIRPSPAKMCIDITCSHHASTQMENVNFNA